MGTYNRFLGIVPAFAIAILFLGVSHVLSQQETITRETNVNITEILDSLLNNYDKRIRPNYGVAPVDVAISMFVMSVESLSDVDMEFTLQCYFREHWKDSRLDFSQFTDLDKILLGPEFSKNIWVPDSFFPNEKRAHLHKVPVPNELIKIMNDGSVVKSVRMTLTASCPMNLQYYPMDSQHCALEIESYRYTADDVKLSWRLNNSFAIDGSASTTEFYVLGHKQKSLMTTLSSGSYSRLLSEITFVRSMCHYLLQVYIPACNIVIVSWFSFWLGEEAAVSRVLFGALSLVSLTILIVFSNQVGPKVSYVKAIDVYTGTCFLMVFASLVEYVAVSYLIRRIQKRKSNLEKNSEQSIESNPKSAESANPKGKQSTISGKVLDKLCGYSPSAIDKVSRIAFPVSFLVFNILYWTIFNCISQPEI